MLLHGEQDLEVHQPIPPEVTITNKAKIAEIWDKGKAARYQARFAGVGFPGETYRISYWKEGDEILIAANSKDRDNAPIISNAAITVRS